MECRRRNCWSCRGHRILCTYMYPGTPTDDQQSHAARCRPRICIEHHKSPRPTCVYSFLFAACFDHLGAWRIAGPFYNKVPGSGVDLVYRAPAAAVQTTDAGTSRPSRLADQRPVDSRPTRVGTRDPLLEKSPSSLLRFLLAMLQTWLACCLVF